MTRSEGEFYGTMGALERLARRYHGRITWEPGFKGTPVTPLYVDAAGTIYAASSETGKLTRIAGRCHLLAIPMKGSSA